jgi:hydroxymethylbilane synthase
LALVEGDAIDFRCELFSADGADHVRESARFAVGDMEAPAALARAMLDRAPNSIRSLFESE